MHFVLLKSNYVNKPFLNNNKIRKMVRVGTTTTSSTSSA